MVFSEEDKVLIKNLYLLKGYGARRLMTEFPNETLEPWSAEFVTVEAAQDRQHQPPERKWKAKERTH